MQRCLELAQNGDGNVAPNPLVGCVIVHEGRIIGEGFHRQYGGPHAEPNAINSIENPALLRSSTLYVNLEPCAHHGKTPPCADLIVNSGIPKVVIANRDPFEAVDGKGIERLKNAGVEVITGVCEAEGRHLNRRFFTFHEQKRPYILLKWAQTANGLIDIDRTAGAEGSAWITHPNTRKLVHQWRSRHAAILVGSKTVKTDNPELTVRDVAGKQPLRVVLDPHGEVQDASLRIYNDAAPTLYVGQKWPDATVDTLEASGASLITPVLDELYRRNIQSVLIEGGKYTLEQFITAGLWDEARVLTGQTVFASGAFAPKITASKTESFDFGPDRITTYFK